MASWSRISKNPLIISALAARLWAVVLSRIPTTTPAVGGRANTEHSGRCALLRAKVLAVCQVHRGTMPLRGWNQLQQKEIREGDYRDQDQAEEEEEQDRHDCNAERDAGDAVGGVRRAVHPRPVASMTEYRHTCTQGVTCRACPEGLRPGPAVAWPDKAMSSHRMAVPGYSCYFFRFWCEDGLCRPG